MTIKQIAPTVRAAINNDRILYKKFETILRKEYGDKKVDLALYVINNCKYFKKDCINLKAAKIVKLYGSIKAQITNPCDRNFKTRMESIVRNNILAKEATNFFTKAENKYGKNIVDRARKLEKREIKLTKDNTLYKKAKNLNKAKKEKKDSWLNIQAQYEKFIRAVQKEYVSKD